MSRNRLLELAQNDLGSARDNLARARAAARECDPSKQWGQSGQTLNEIIAGYEEWERDAMDALDVAREPGTRKRLEAASERD